MQFTQAALISLLPALSMATGFRGSKAHQSDAGASLMASTDNAGSAPGQNLCGVSTFVGSTESPNAELPLVDDCKKLVAAIAGDYYWIVYDTPAVIVSNGTCAFGVQTSAGTDPNLHAYIGNSDVIDLVNDSIDKYARNGYVACRGSYNMLVSAAGGMSCDSPDAPNGQQVGVDWTITRS